MSDVVMVYVREDIGRAEQLAEMFDDFGFSVSCELDDGALARCGAGVVVWTDAAAASPPLSDVIRRVIASGKSVVLNFSAAAAPEGSHVSYDLSAWSGDPEDPALDAMFFALDRRVVAARAARSVLQQLEEKAQAKAARPVAPAPERVAPKPRIRTMAASLALVGLAIVGAFAFRQRPEAPTPIAVVALPRAPDEAPRVTLTGARARTATYDLTAPPVEDATIGRRGLEPPSAASVRRAERTPPPARARSRANVGAAERVPASFSEPASDAAPKPPPAKPGGDA